MEWRKDEHIELENRYEICYITVAVKMNSNTEYD